MLATAVISGQGTPIQRAKFSRFFAAAGLAGEFPAISQRAKKVADGCRNSSYRQTSSSKEAMLISRKKAAAPITMIIHFPRRMKARGGKGRRRRFRRRFLATGRRGQRQGRAARWVGDIGLFLHAATMRAIPPRLGLKCECRH